MPGKTEDFARRELLEEGETLERAQPKGPFVAAHIRLAADGYVIRVAQPRVIEQGHHTNVPLITELGPWGPAGYTKAARRFNKLVDEDLQ